MSSFQSTSYYLWQNGFRIVEGQASCRADVAESWRVQEGTMRGRQEHMHRWVQSCSQVLGMQIGGLARQVFEAALEQLPRHGDWFPRLDLHLEPSPHFNLQIRPCPELKTVLRLDPHGWDDPRQYPARKGPDLNRLADLRQKSLQSGFDEGFLISGHHIISEGIYCSFIWWRDGQCYRTAPSIATLPGITLSLLECLSTTIGIKLQHGILRTDELFAGPLWACNALHGLMEVSHIGTTALPRNPTDLIRWRQALQSTQRPLTET